MEGTLVHNRQSHADVVCEVVTHLSYDDFVRTQKEWDNIKAEAGLQLAAADESVEWSWPQKFSARLPRHRFLALQVAGRVEGLMQVDLTWVPTHQNGKTRPKVLYVEHLETAPRNQGRFVGEVNIVYAGVGTGLILAANQLSSASGLAGRIGLHALPQSENFYRRLRAEEQPVFEELGLGFLEYPGLRYFEKSDD